MCKEWRSTSKCAEPASALCFVCGFGGFSFQRRGAQKADFVAQVDREAVHMCHVCTG